MSNATYQVIFQGVAEGFKLQEVKERLADLFKVAPEKMEPLFNGKWIVLKRELDSETALKYKSVLESAGARCQIEPVEREDRSEETMVCPKCGFEQKESAACGRCGIILDKYQRMVEKHREEEEEEEDELMQMRALGAVAVEEPAAEDNGAVANLTGFIRERYKLLSAGVVALVAILSLLEFVFLRGDLVTSGSISIGNEYDSLAIYVDQPWVNYLVEVTTGKKKRKLSLRLEDKIGRVIYRDTEYSSHKGSRTFSFEPKENGIYRLYVNPGVLTFGEWGYARVHIYVNDHRILNRVFSRLNF